MTAGGVRTQYPQKRVREIRRSNASPDALGTICVCAYDKKGKRERKVNLTWASVTAGAEEARRMHETTKTGL
jgi:hypothetical protein